MSEVIVEISPSVDGFVAGRGVTVDRPFGDAGHRLHRWIGFDGATPGEADRFAAARMFATAGAFVLGRRMFDVGIGLWGEDGAFGKPCFVVTNRAQEQIRRGPTTFTFVTAGVEAAVAQARVAARDADVVVNGGASIIQQCLAADLIDEIRLHVVPVILGGGLRLFADAPAGTGSPLGRAELHPTDAVATPLATHLTYRLRPT